MVSDEDWWAAPPPSPLLGAGEVHVWRASADRSPPDVERLASSLSSDERARAARFVFERDRTSFQVAHGALRDLLGRYLAVEPGRLEFLAGPHGRPELAAPAADGLSFNLSHSGGVVLVAVTRGRRIGVDVERVRPLRDLLALSRRFFQPAEDEALRLAAPEALPSKFFELWTAKEAIIKATGEGLSGLEGVELALALGAPPAALKVSGSPDGAGRWVVKPLQAGPEYRAALAADSAGFSLRTFEWG